MPSVSERSPALLLKMRAMRELFSAAERRVLDYILANPEKVIYLSVAGLADLSGVSDATVVRTCQKLGMAGYQELKVTLAQDLVTPLQNIHEEVRAEDDAAAILDKVVQSTIHTLTLTHDTAKPETLEAAACAILGARRVCIYGLGNSHAVALDLQHKLNRLGLDAAAFTDPHLQAINASYCAPGDLVFAISHSGSSRDIVDSVRIARARGARIVTLTNIGVSPLQREADIALFTASQETRYRIVALSSRIAQITLIDVIYTIAAMRKEGAVEGFHRVDQALQAKKY